MFTCFDSLKSFNVFEGFLSSVSKVVWVYKSKYCHGVVLMSEINYTYRYVYVIDVCISTDKSKWQVLYSGVVLDNFNFRWFHFIQKSKENFTIL